MTLEKVIWTALPNGVARDGRLRLSLHVAPRLRNDDGSDTPRQLGEFAAFVNWPERVNTFRFEVQFQGGPTGKGKPEMGADPDLWRHLFPPETPVGPHVFQDHAKRDLHSFPVRDVLQFLKKSYGAAAAAGANLPSIDDPAGPLAPFSPLSRIPIVIQDSQSFYSELARAHEKVKPDGKVVFEHIGEYGLPGDVQAAQDTFFQAYRFYTRPGSQRPDFPVDHVEPSPKPHAFDFHQMLSSLSDHPALLRRLGIVIDLLVEIEPGLVPPTGSVRVVPDGDLPEQPPVSPATRYDFKDRWFGAKPAQDYRMDRGFLRLGRELFDLYQVDVNGAALQAVDFGVTLEALKDPERRSEATPSEAGLPALRSAGLALARARRADTLLEDLKDRRGKNLALETAHPVSLDAEDLVRGYRVDVFDEDAPHGGRWFSLHRRATRHTFTQTGNGEAPEPLKVSDEGYLKATSASSENAEHPNASDDLYLHEAIAGWDGWSLAAARPGKRIVEPGEGETGSNIARHDPKLGNPFPLLSEIGVEPGTLPRLRVGHAYRMRVRAVDLAGNSVPFTEKDLADPKSDLVSETQRYQRFEPLPSPPVLRRHIDTEGESLEHLVIRSNLGSTAAEYVNRPEIVKALADANAKHSYAEDSQRHLAPPKASQAMAEEDGRLDAAFGGSPAAVNTALRVSLREEGTFLDEFIVDIATGQRTIAQEPISLFPAGAAMPASRGAGLADGAYAYYQAKEVVLPYLPDPLAIGVALTGYDFAGNEQFHQIALFNGDWPALTPMRLRLSEGPLGAGFTANVLEVTLPKAEMIWARLSSVFPEKRLPDLAIWNWVPAAAQTDALRKAAIHGRHWMLTPYRQVIFTHAVQQPLVAPDMTKVLSSRTLGSTYAQFRGPVANHAKSTGRLDIYADWTEDVDLVTEDAPRMRAFGSEVAHQAQAFGFEITRAETDALVEQHQGRHEFGDTKYRRVTYHSVATTRFREYLPRPFADVTANIQRVESATDDSGLPKPGLEHHIPSSARPASPDLLYVLPTFRWERQDEGEVRKHVRHGKSVRVWLRRPWFSSGDGEQLGVILEPTRRLPPVWGEVAHTGLVASDVTRLAPQISVLPLRAGTRALTNVATTPFLSGSSGGVLTAQDATQMAAYAVVPPPTPEQRHRMLQPYVTAWGSDPVWRSALPDARPTVGAFPRHAGYASGLTLEELPHSVTVVVAAHDVLFDHGRKLWYCDIEIDPGESYFPFVRLALARYQAHSVAHAHLSRVVMTDFIQLVPDRTASVQLTQSDAVITVQGMTGRNTLSQYSANPYVVQTSAEPRPNTIVRVAIERRTPGIPGDLGWARVGSEVTLSAAYSDFRGTWSGAVAFGPEMRTGEYRLMITEVETYFRDMVAGDPRLSTSPLDFTRERVVFADTFEFA